MLSIATLSACDAADGPSELGVDACTISVSISQLSTPPNTGRDSVCCWIVPVGINPSRDTRRSQNDIVVEGPSSGQQSKAAPILTLRQRTIFYRSCEMCPRRYTLQIVRNRKIGRNAVGHQRRMFDEVTPRRTNEYDEAEISTVGVSKS